MNKTNIFSKILNNNYSNSPIVIAEIGSSHNGNINKAYELINTAKKSGADCAKFQIIIADEIVHPKTGKINLPGGNIDIYDSFKKLEQNKEFYYKLKEYTEKQGLCFLASPFGLKSAEILKELNIDAIKIASPEINHLPLLNYVRTLNIPIIISTGVSKLSDIKKAIKIISDKTILLHCSTAYPTPETEYNLKTIPYLQKKFKIPVGISDHSKDPILVPVISAAMGAVIIEKHICLNNNGKGLDDPIALGPEDFKKMVKAVKKTKDNNIKDIIADLNYPKTMIKKVIGEKHKKMSPSEKTNYKTTNRSILTIRDIKKNEIITDDKIAILRSEHNLKPGTSPFNLHKIIGKKAKRNMNSAYGILLSDVK